MSGPFNPVVGRLVGVRVPGDVQFSGVVACGDRQPGDGGLPGSCVCAYVDVITAVVAASAAISTMAVISVVCFSLAVGIYLIPRPLRFRAV